MTERGNYHINWDDFTTTSAERFRDLVGKKEFSDVTLVTEDGSRIPSHQVILASGSTFFKNLLVDETVWHCEFCPAMFGMVWHGLV